LLPVWRKNVEVGDKSFVQRDLQRRKVWKRRRGKRTW
jgi:hypothetical protein